MLRGCLLCVLAVRRFDGRRSDLTHEHLFGQALPNPMNTGLSVMSCRTVGPDATGGLVTPRANRLTALRGPGLQPISSPIALRATASSVRLRLWNFDNNADSRLRTVCRLRYT